MNYQWPLLQAHASSSKLMRASASSDAMDVLGRCSANAQVGAFRSLWELKMFFLSLWGALGLESISSLVSNEGLLGLLVSESKI